MVTKTFRAKDYSGKTVIVDPTLINLLTFSVRPEGLEIILLGNADILDQIELVETPTHILVSREGAVQVR